MTDVLVVGGIFREVFADQEPGRVRVGGSGLTAAVTAARLGAAVKLIAPVGEEDAEQARGTLRQAGVDSSGLLVCPGASGTFVFLEALTE